MTTQNKRHGIHQPLKLFWTCGAVTTVLKLGELREQPLRICITTFPYHHYDSNVSCGAPLQLQHFPLLRITFAVEHRR